MIARILTAALLAGLVAGLLTSALQHVVTVPVILAAEVFEKAPAAHDHAMAADQAMPGMAAGEDHEHDANAWAPSDGIERVFFTTLATVLASVGFALVLLAVMIIADEKPTPRRALAWAAGAFASFSLAPAMGLSPELPGMEAAPIVARQLWWAATVAATGGGLYLALRGRGLLAIAAGVALIALPHVIGAPSLGSVSASAVPAELAARFVASVLGVAAVMWALIGVGLGLVWQRIDQGQT